METFCSCRTKQNRFANPIAPVCGFCLGKTLSDIKKKKNLLAIYIFSQKIQSTFGLNIWPLKSVETIHWFRLELDWVWGLKLASRSENKFDISWNRTMGLGMSAKTQTPNWMLQFQSLFGSIEFPGCWFSLKIAIWFWYMILQHTGKNNI